MVRAIEEEREKERGGGGRSNGGIGKSEGREEVVDRQVDL